MARPAKFTADRILDAALAATARHGKAATIADVAQQIEVPIGSIYHRFASRDELFVSLWLRAVRRFQAGLLDAAEGDDPTAALLACAVHIPRYCRQYPDEAVALTLYRHAELVRSGPPLFAEDVRTVNDTVTATILGLARSRYGRLDEHLAEVVHTAVVQCPYGLVRPHVGSDVPEWLDEAVRAAAIAILTLGDPKAA